MNKKKPEDIKRLAMVITFICIIILLLIVLIWLTHSKDKTSPRINNVVNEINNNTSGDYRNDESNYKNDISNTNTSINENNQSDYSGKLTKVVDMEIYFWIKDRTSLYYSSNYLYNPLEMMDEEVINELNMTSDNYKKFNDFASPSFRIDEIYEQILSNNKTLYVVKLKYGTNEQDVKNSIIWIKKDSKNDTFSIYPYEYLRIKNYLDFKEGDVISVDSKTSIKENSESKYLKAIEKDNNDDDESDNDKDTEKCMKGLFERYKFDLLIDNEHLYEILSDEYKKTKFPEISEFKQYIKEHISDLNSDTLSEYKIVNYNEYVEYRAICKSQRNIVFNAKNMMDYTISLDNYTIVQNKDMYNAFLPAAEAKYCVDRVVQALNYKDYDFVYSKLNPVQKNNYYKNVNEFKNYLSKALYEQNSYEIDDNYLIISDNVYQFTVTIRDATGGEFTYSKFTMAVTLKDDADFIISIVNSDN